MPYEINEDKSKLHLQSVCECPVKAECVMHTSNIITREAEIGNFQVQGQPRLCSNSTSKQNTQNCSAEGPGMSLPAHLRNTYTAH